MYDYVTVYNRYTYVWVNGWYFCYDDNKLVDAWPDYRKAIFHK